MQPALPGYLLDPTAYETNFSPLVKDELLVFTDFASFMALHTFQMRNCSVDGHTVNDNFVCIYNQRTMKMKDLKNEKENRNDHEMAMVGEDR